MIKKWQRIDIIIFCAGNYAPMNIKNFNLDEAKNNGRSEHEVWLERKDGTRFLASLLVTALYDHRGLLTGFSQVTRDITEKREAEKNIPLSYLESLHKYHDEWLINKSKHHNDNKHNIRRC